MTYDDRLEHHGACPHCGAPIMVDPMPPMERTYCGVCGLRSPLFPRYGDGERRALVWMQKGLASPQDDDSLVGAARRMVNAWDRQDLEACERALEELRARVPGRRVSGAPPNRRK